MLAEDAETRPLLHCSENIKLHRPLESSLTVSLKTTIQSSNCLPGHLSQQINETYIFTQKPVHEFSQQLSIVVQNWKQLKCLSMDEW